MPTKEPSIQCRIRAWVSEDDARELRRLRKVFGFRSDYQLFKSSVLLVLRLLQKAERKGVEMDEDTIEDTFTALSDWEAPELGKRPKRGSKEASLVHLLFGIDNAPIEDRVGEKALTDPRPEVQIWYEKFTNRHYQRLYELFAHRTSRPTADGMTPRDLFHETLLRLCYPPDHIDNWDDYQHWALLKFHKAE
jgi:hypothetical protein